MRTTIALPLLLALAVPVAARPQPCEEEVARMRTDLESIAKAVATIEAVTPSDFQAQMLASTRAKYDLEKRRLAEAEARCGTVARPEAPIPAPAAAQPAPEAPPAPATTPPVPAVAPPAAPAPVASSPPVAAPAAATSAVPAPASGALPPTACPEGCRKDVDCKGDRICVKGECVDPPPRR